MVLGAEAEVYESESAVARWARDAQTAQVEHADDIATSTSRSTNPVQGIAGAPQRAKRRICGAERSGARLAPPAVHRRMDAVHLQR